MPRVTAGFRCPPDLYETDAGEDRETPAPVDHQETAAAARVLRQDVVGNHAGTEQQQHGRADDFGEEDGCEIHCDFPFRHR